MRNAFTRSAAAAGTLLLATTATPASAADMGISGHVGTLGAGLDLAYGVSDNLVGRVGFNKLTISEDFTEEDIDYSADLELESVHALADWHVFGGGFRVTGGVVFNGNAFSGDATVESGDQVGDATATSDGRLALDVEYDDVAPYVGIGWGNRVRGWSKVSFSIDAGVMAQGSADVNITNDGVSGVTESDIEEEEREVEDELENFELYPVISASIVYRF